MKKKVVALMLVIPLFILITIFAVSSAVSVAADVPATGIKIVSDSDKNILTLDMATYNNDYKFEAEVMPAKAKNKGYTVSISNDEGTTPCVSVNSDGILLLNNEGKATITAKSNDKGYTSSLDVFVYSSKVYDMKVVAKDDLGKDIEVLASDSKGVDYEVKSIETGTRIVFDTKLNPSNFSGQAIEWSAKKLSGEESNGLIIDEHSGIAECLLSGEYVVQAKCANAVGGELVKNIKVTLDMPINDSGITVNGMSNEDAVSDTAMHQIAPNAESTSFIIESKNKLYKEDFTIADESVLISNFKEVKNGENFSYIVTLAFDKKAVGYETKIDVSYFGSTSKMQIDLICKDYIVSIASANNKNTEGDLLIQKKGMVVNYSAFIAPFSNDVKCEWSCDNKNAILKQNNKGCSILLNEECETIINLKAVIDGVEYNISNNLLVVEHQINPLFENKDNQGIKRINALADTIINNNYYEANINTLLLSAQFGNERRQSNSNAWILTSSDNSVATINENGEINIFKDGYVTFNAKWKYSDYFEENINTSIKCEVVKDGVLVSNSKDIMKATKENKKIVLANDIDFGKDMTDAEIIAMLKSQLMPTTWDWTYYKNLSEINKTELKRPQVLYAIEFTNNVYGNGHTINMQAITKAYDGNNPRYFRGPLDFVGVGNKANVKGQDNISFLVRKDNIKIDNIILKGCSDEALILEDKDGNAYLELNELNYVGTVLEIMGDNVSLLNSRVSNGRTVVRVYGGGVSENGSPILNKQLTKEQVSNERITVNIESSILSQAREFILKEGTNRALACERVADVSKYKQTRLVDENGVPFTAGNKILDPSDKAFYDITVLTDLTLKNCVLDTSGLFAVGVESHFSGPFLTGEGQFKAQFERYGWKDLAATSYSSVLRLEGDVRIYDWKDLQRVDSSTLIESNGEGGDLLTQVINLDIGKMLAKIKTLANKPEYQKYQNVITTVEDKNYVHGGIAFYGGGYNYSKIDLSNFSGAKLANYNVNIGILAVDEENSADNSEYLQGTLLPLAAGSEDFTFFMYDSKSEFNLGKQQADIDNGSAYSWITGVCYE